MVTQTNGVPSNRSQRRQVMRLPHEHDHIPSEESRTTTVLEIEENPNSSVAKNPTVPTIVDLRASEHTEKDDDILQPSARDIADQANDMPNQSLSDPTARIVYMVVVSRTPKVVIRQWQNGILAQKSLDTLFNEISTFTSKKDVQRIEVTLNTSRRKLNHFVDRGDDRMYDAVKAKLKKKIKKDTRSSGNSKIVEIRFEPNPRTEDVTAEAGEADFDFEL